MDSSNSLNSSSRDWAQEQVNPPVESAAEYHARTYRQVVEDVLAGKAIPTAAPEVARAALDVQVGGDHYKHYAIQPVEFIHANNIPFCEATAIKYLIRWREKNGIQDLEKAKHYIDLLIQLESRKSFKSN